MSVALVSSGRPLIGMLVAPARGEEWVAVAGHGATLNNLPIRASQRTQFTGARVPTHSLPKDDSDLVAVEQPNSIALRMAMVAADEAGDADLEEAEEELDDQVAHAPTLRPAALRGCGWKARTTLASKHPVTPPSLEDDLYCLAIRSRRPWAHA